MTLGPGLQSGGFLRTVFGVLHVAEVILTSSDVNEERKGSTTGVFYLALLGILVNVREEIFRKLESDSKEDE